VALYNALKDPATSKTVVLQTAQRKLLEGDRFQHPFFWSPFLLIGNWL
jgi:CHAT domain-containing protein